MIIVTANASDTYILAILKAVRLFHGQVVDDDLNSRREAREACLLPSQIGVD